MSGSICAVKIDKRWSLVTIGILILTVISYFYADKQLFELLYPHRGDAAFYPIDLLTDLGKSTWYIIGSLLIFIVYKKSRSTLSQAGLFVLYTTILSGVLVNIIKVLFGRARPQLYADEHLYGFFWFKFDVLYRSFPSGHAATAIGVWLAFALLLPRYRWWLIGMGILISLSRVALTQHYLSDVLIGGWIGAMTTLILYGMFYPKESTVGN